MALELKRQIGNITSIKTGLRYEVVKWPYTVVDSGTLDTTADGWVTVSMAGKNVQLGDNLRLLVDDADGVNYDTAGHALKWMKVTDDGVAPPSKLKLVFAGDSLTDNSSSDTTDGLRPNGDGVGMTVKGYWTSAAYVYAESDYIFRPDMGRSGQGTAGMVLPDRLAEMRNSDADVLVLMIGVNDCTNTGGDLATATTNYSTIVNEMRRDNKFKVLIVPVMHRNDSIYAALHNAFIDDLNAFCATLAATTDGVEIVPVNHAMNALITSGTSDVLVDDLHTSNKGGMMQGKHVAPYLDSLFPSTIDNKFNLAPTSLIGTGGNIYAGATGTIPAGYTARYGNNSTSVGVEVVDRGGKNWLKIRTNGGIPSGSNNTMKISLDDVLGVPSGAYVAEALIEVETPEVVSRISLYSDPVGSTYDYCSIGAFGTGVEVDIYEKNVPHRLRSPSAFCDGEGMSMFLSTTQVQGVDAVIYVTDINLYKVEELV